MNQKDIAKKLIELAERLCEENEYDKYARIAKAEKAKSDALPLKDRLLILAARYDKAAEELDKLGLKDEATDGRERANVKREKADNIVEKMTDRELVDAFFKSARDAGKKIKGHKHMCPKCGSNDTKFVEEHPDTEMDEIVGKCNKCGYAGESLEFKEAG